MTEKTGKGKKKLWLLTAPADRADVCYAMATAAWMAGSAGALFECYLECERSGRLFAATGSTVLGGDHLRQFNYLHSVFDVSHMLLGGAAVFRSSIDAFGAEVLAEEEDTARLYAALLAQPGVAAPAGILVGPASPGGPDGKTDLRPYLYPEIFFPRMLGFAAAPAKSESAGLPAELEVRSLSPEGGYAEVTSALAGRWEAEARGVAFGDPAMIRALIPKLCRDRRPALYAPKDRLPTSRVRVAPYPEEKSPLADRAAELAVELGDRVIVGRQTGDGDIFEWSKRGVSVQIMDPNRPVFPVVEAAPQRWAAPGTDLLAGEPDDLTLERWADEGKVLATLIWHSGEVAHTEAMLNLVDLASRTGLKMGLGAHAARYATAPQDWELLSVPRERGGARGLLEPVLHCGGLGVMAECNFPPEMLEENCREALAAIREVAGEAGCPRGYYAFMDADLATLSPARPELYAAVRRAGLGYFISSAVPGLNRVIVRDGDFVVVNQTPRCVCPASPFVRITTAEEIEYTATRTSPGWMIATLDTPVIAFDHYIWREGSRFMQIADWLLKSPGAFVNVLPHTIARYARLLHRRGLLPGGNG